MALPLAPFSDKICYYLNGGAVGDLTACSAVLKYAINTFHTPRGTDYRVAVFSDFKDLFPQVPNDKFVTMDEGIALGDFAVRKMNIDRGTVNKNVATLTPSRFHLVHYASIGLMARIVDLEKLPYVPLKEVPVDHFGVDWDKAIVLVVTYRDASRMWPGSEIVKTASAIQEMGLTPVYVGKTGAVANWKKNLAKTQFEYPGFGVDLTNKTSLSEMATLMGKSRAVLGMDSGPIHVAFTTKVPVISGFTNVSPNLRIPYRENAVTIPIIAEDLVCRFCQSDWNLDYWNFTKCPRGQEIPECTAHMTAEKFIAAVKKVCGR